MRRRGFRRSKGFFQNKRGRRLTFWFVIVACASIILLVLLCSTSIMMNKTLERHPSQRRSFYYKQTTPQHHSHYHPPYKETSSSSIPKCLVFLHIPKAGGRTLEVFWDQLVEFVSLEETPYRVYSTVAANPELINPLNRRIFGHFTTRIFQLNPRLQQCFTMTILREPVDRAVSAYFFHGKTFNDLHKCFAKSPLVRKQSCQYYWEYSNDMMRYFAPPREISWNSYYWGRKVVPLAKSEHLIQAKQNIQRYFDLVCFLEDLPACAQKILNAFQLHNNVDVDIDIDVSMMRPLKNGTFGTNARPKTLDDDTWSKFQHANQLDIDLYQWARSNYH